MALLSLILALLSLKPALLSLQMALLTSAFLSFCGFFKISCCSTESILQYKLKYLCFCHCTFVPNLALLSLKPALLSLQMALLTSAFLSFSVFLEISCCLTELMLKYKFRHLSFCHGTFVPKTGTFVPANGTFDLGIFSSVVFSNLVVA